MTPIDEADPRSWHLPALTSTHPLPALHGILMPQGGKQITTHFLDEVELVNGWVDTLSWNRRGKTKKKILNYLTMVADSNSGCRYLVQQAHN